MSSTIIICIIRYNFIPFYIITYNLCTYILLYIYIVLKIIINLYDSTSIICALLRGPHLLSGPQRCCDQSAGLRYMDLRIVFGGFIRDMYNICMCIYIYIVWWLMINIIVEMMFWWILYTMTINTISIRINNPP